MNIYLTFFFPFPFFFFLPQTVPLEDCVWLSTPVIALLAQKKKTMSFFDAVLKKGSLFLSLFMHSLLFPSPFFLFLFNSFFYLFIFFTEIEATPSVGLLLRGQNLTIKVLSVFMSISGKDYLTNLLQLFFREVIFIIFFLFSFLKPLFIFICGLNILPILTLFFM